MSKSGEGKKGPARRAGRSRGTEASEGEPEGVEADIVRLRQEAETLRKALEDEQERAKKLEAASSTVAGRLEEAIASIRRLLERQG